MAVQRVLALINGKFQEYVAKVISAGGADAGNLVALDGSGRLDTSVMPSGIGANTSSILASEAIAAGSLVNVYSNAGTANARNADGSTTGKEANGFVLAAVASGASATVYFSGVLSGLSGQVPGAVYLGTTAGTVAATGAAAVGQTYQLVGTAISATSVSFEPDAPIYRA